jgi:tryptophanyl-tRNA synthetase
MSADILMYKATMVPVGQDQLPHLELCREIARRYNYFYGQYFPEPQAQLTETAKLPGLDGRKMSKSYGNAISLGEDLSQMGKKIMSMLTDTDRKRLKDPGDPANCNLFPYLQLLAPGQDFPEIREGCTQATRGCMECKKLLVKKMEEFLAPIQAKRNELKANPDLVQSILDQGTAKAREEAQHNMQEIREKMGFGR